MFLYVLCTLGTQIKHELAQMDVVDLLPNKSHAIANVSLLARLQKLSIATLSIFSL